MANHLAMALEEAQSHFHEESTQTVRLASARPPQHQVARRWSHALRARPLESGPLQTWLDENPRLRSSLRRARCIAKGARRVRRGALGNPLAQARLGVERPLYWKRGETSPNLSAHVRRPRTRFAVSLPVRRIAVLVPVVRAVE